MKLYQVSGVIRCGHRTYTINKNIIANSTEQVIAMYRQDYPHAKMIKVRFKYEVERVVSPCIIISNP